MSRPDGVKWERIMTLHQFASKWLPTISGTNPKRFMLIEVAFPFEWNSYETWNVVQRVKFTLPSEWISKAPTRVNVMNGWQSTWNEYLNRIDAEAEAYYLKRTGKPYDIGDNTRPEMRELIQAPIVEPQPPTLHVVEDRPSEGTKQ